MNFHNVQNSQKCIILPGKITSEQLKAGYESLKEISEQIKAGKTSGPTLLQACNDFYTRIPHEFGMRVPPKITTMQMVKKKIELLEALGDIQVWTKYIFFLNSPKGS